jgi:hypothetical protein
MYKNMKLDAFGKKLEILRENGAWVIYELGEGKKSRSQEIFIPSEYNEDEVVLFLEDMLHEAASSANPKIKKLDQ